MTVSITGGPARKRLGDTFSQEALTQSTATAFQSLNLTTDLSILGMGTATGHGINRYSLGHGREGQSKLILATATGEAHVHLSGGTATGLWVLGEKNDWLSAQYFASGWFVGANGATVATAT